MYGDDVGALLVVEGQTQHPVRWAETEEIGQDWVEGKIEFQNLTQSLNVSMKQFQDLFPELNVV